MIGERVGPPVQLRVGQRSLCVNHGGRVGGLLNLALEKLVQAEVSFFHGLPTTPSCFVPRVTAVAREDPPLQPKC
ncbi:MAG: hypothetical protein AVDCRST_MAG12-2155 [uncultured Rubrobacteraceae bacterium]|uniref:Uncharacterized protein n=1 Tax=uncultured Rubrobacteraceae bacterium TaxID=349277 RepID=A0A6J4S7X4_9ACTN|nr:MAG: hypothetical protein AVDCRST_MAG12-2155 [uncultured Rubrobacteraceae bacterium]